jgi:hypothetical protein
MSLEMFVASMRLMLEGGWARSGDEMKRNISFTRIGKVV